MRINGIAPTPTDAIPESISDGVFTVDLGWRITSFNRAAEGITGMSRKDAIGRLCSEIGVYHAMLEEVSGMDPVTCNLAIPIQEEVVHEEDLQALREDQTSLLRDLA